MKNKKILLSVLAPILFFSQQTAFAAAVYSPSEALAGSTIEIEIPADNILNIEGEFMDEPILFYKTTHAPKLDSQITRGEFLELLFKNHQFKQADTSDTTDFPDINETSHYYNYIKKAAALNIIHGYEDGLFRPDTFITRGQIAKVLVNAFSPSQTTGLNTVEFPDVPPDHVFYSHIQQGVQQKWFQGYPDGLMRPDRDINHGEAEIVIRRSAIPEIFQPLEAKTYFHAYAGIHRLAEPGLKTINIKITKEDNQTEQKSVSITILKRTVPIVRFSLPKEKTDLFGDDAQKQTWDAINNSKKIPNPQKLWNNKFIIPAQGRVTLGFGDKLYINGIYSGSHFGIDYANPTGTPINAANSGIVTLAQYTPAFGNTIVIDHGQNIFTMYLHMEELKAVTGQAVEQNDIIGLMGSTGISSGSHLHYTLFIGNIIVDSEPWN
jgi:murein DD-endopeptidase MepM/ murein hydrolase activator NlpD